MPTKLPPPGTQVKGSAQKKFPSNKAASFAVARMRRRGRGAFVVLVFAAQMAPWEALLVPMFSIAGDTDLFDSLLMLTCSPRSIS